MYDETVGRMEEIGWKIMVQNMFQPGLRKDKIVDHPINKFGSLIAYKFADNFIKFFFGKCGQKVNYNFHSKA